MANNLYTPTGNPGAITRGASALIRAEFVLIASALANSPLISDVLGWLATWGNPVNANGQALTNLPNGVNPQDAATMANIANAQFGQVLPATANLLSVPVIRSGTIGWQLPPDYYSNMRALRYYRLQRAGFNT
jgi:hypothetical protein